MKTDEYKQLEEVMESLGFKVLLEQALEKIQRHNEDKLNKSQTNTQD
jgi:hypothetical protein